jgi:hypothetical protein
LTVAGSPDTAEITGIAIDALWNSGARSTVRSPFITFSSPFHHLFNTLSSPFQHLFIAFSSPFHRLFIAFSSPFQHGSMDCVSKIMHYFVL